MPRRKYSRNDPSAQPGYRLHKTSGQACVRIDGRTHYLGKHNTPESWSKYHRLLSEWRAGTLEVAAGNGQAGPVTTVAGLTERFLEHARIYYRRSDGRQTSEVACHKTAFVPLLELYAEMPAGEFGAAHLRLVRDAMIRRGWCRKVVNGMVGRVRRVFEWAAEGSIDPRIDDNIGAILRSVKPLKEHRSQAPEYDPVEPVELERVNAIRDHVPAPVWAMVQLQLCTGARGGELFELRPCDIDRSGDVWTAKLKHHKTAHRGKERVLHFAARAQAVLRPFLERDPEAFLFSPRESYLAAKGRMPQAGKGPKSFYTKDSYARAIARGCARAFPATDDVKADPAKLKAWRKRHYFHPHQLRHTAGTRAREQFGLEAAQALLGHANMSMTEHYARQSTAKAEEIARMIG